MLLTLVSVSSAYGYLVISSISGKDGVSGYRAVNDTITLNVSSVAGAVSLSNQSCPCSQNGGLFFCVCTITDSIMTASASYTVNNSEPDSAFKTITLDNSIGDITYYVAFSLDNGTVKTVLQYAITDTAFNGGSGCAGIKDITVHWGSSELTTVVINTSQFSGCTISDSVAIPVTNSGTDEFYLDVSDRVGNHKISEKKNITIDVTPPDISHLQVMQGDEVLSTISHHAALSVDVTFDIVEENISTITADLSSFNSNPASTPTLRSVVVPKSNCVYNATDVVYHCIIRNVALYINDADVNPSITVTDTFGNKNTVSENITFIIDDTIPKPSDIGTNHCDSAGNCFVNREDNIFSVVLDKDNFLTKHIAFQLDNQIIPVVNCSERVCVSGNITLACTSGQSLRLRIAAGSTDDSGNPVDPIEKSVTCDTTAPTFVNDSWSSDYVSNLLISGATITVNTVVRESDSAELNASAYLEKLKNSTEDGQCEKNDSDTFSCTWIINAINDGYYDAAMQFMYSDTAGNTLSKTITKRLLGFKSDNTTPNSLVMQFNPRDVTPKSGINRIALDLASQNRLDFFTYATYTVAAKPGKNPKILYQTVKASDCIYINKKGYRERNRIFSEVTIADPYTPVGQKNRIDFMFSKDLDPSFINGIDNEFKISCNISAMVQEGNEVYTKPQILTIEIPFVFRNSALPTPGQAITDKIKAQENNDWVKFEMLGTLNKLVATLQTICQFKTYLEAGQFMGTAIGVAGDMLKGVSFGLGQQMSNSGIQLNLDMTRILQCFYAPEEKNANTQLDNIYYSDKSKFPGVTNQQVVRFDAAGKALDVQPAAQNCGSFVKKACTFLSCQVANKAASSDNTMYTLEDTIGEKGLFKNANITDPANSILAAIDQKCWPAIVFNLNKYRQTECNYLYCLKTSSLHATDISVCDKVKTTQTCSLVVGQIMDAPQLPLKFVKNYANNLRDIANNIGPLAANTIAKKTICSEYDFTNIAASDIYSASSTAALPPSWKIYACQIPIQIAQFIDGNRRSTRAARFKYEVLPDMCEQAKCVGQPNCQIEQNMWSTLNNINIPQPKFTQKQYTAIAKANDDRATLIALNYKYTTNKLTDPTEIKQFTQLLSSDGTAVDISDAEKAGKAYNARVNELAEVKMFGGKSLEEMKKDASLADPVYLEYHYEQNVKRIDALETTINDFGKLSYAETKKIIAAKYGYAEKDGKFVDKDGKAPTTDFLDNKWKDTYDTPSIALLTNMEDAGVCSSAGCQADWNLAVKQYKETGSTKELNDIKAKLNTPDKISGLTKKQEYQHEQDKYAQVQSAQQFGEILNFGLQFLYSSHVLDFMTTENWGSEWFNGVIKYLDTEEWKTSLCNPDVVNIAGGTSSDGSFISCKYGACQPVLNFAAERVEMTRANTSINNSHYYIYTLVYYLGPVYAEQDDPDITFNIEFRGSGVVAKGYTAKQTLGKSEVKQVTKAFASVKKFDELCMVFDSAYPPRVIGADTIFCRDIKENVFNTGNPAVDEGLIIPSAQLNSAIGVDTRNVQTNRGTTPQEPGVLE